MYRADGAAALWSSGTSGSEGAFLWYWEGGTLTVLGSEPSTGTNFTAVWLVPGLEPLPEIGDL
ncbi:hypothetical protein [Cellulomonas marina]|uniref:D-mannose binding lectin n=1 Tax=Cellulomonas marina TaxID=988821 RepID=A0A1I0Y305_9CELL|nr:hypothetical protein [Cellulomonas marina]GIG29759.1 hypothetical protein Cma02nite_23590 [Cellulomonas marina]SFB07524.1 hypothetical protein SAMN05421867_106141 [Cellulomonas marina]